MATATVAGTAVDKFWAAFTWSATVFEVADPTLISSWWWWAALDDPPDPDEWAGRCIDTKCNKSSSDLILCYRKTCHRHEVNVVRVDSSIDSGLKWQKAIIEIGSWFEMWRSPLVPCAVVEWFEWVDLSESGLEDLDPIAMGNASNPWSYANAMPHSVVIERRPKIPSKTIFEWWREFEFQTSI